MIVFDEQSLQITSQHNHEDIEHIGIIHVWPPCSEKCVLSCCTNFPCINLPDQETDNQNSDTAPSIRFHIYHIFECCTDHVRISLKDKSYVTCVNKNLHQMNQQKYTPEKS